MKKFLEIFVFIVFTISLLGLIATICMFYSIGTLNISKINYDKIGAIGDFLGGFYGTLITIATIILVWLTYQSQKEELKDTKILLAEQNFESSFFNLMNLLKETVNSMDLVIYKPKKNHSITANEQREVEYIVKGRDCFIRFVDTFKYYRRSKIDEAIVKTYLDNESDLAHYIKMIKNIIKRIDSKKNNQFYIDTFNSCFSGFELVFLNYFMYSEYFTQNEKELICKFKTLDDIDLKKLLQKGDRYEFNHSK